MDASLLSHFNELPDPRVDRTKHYPLIEIIFLVISATISGSEGWKAIKDFGDIKLDWLRKFLPFESGIPVDDTIARVMRRLDTKAFQNCFVNWMQAIVEHTENDIVAIDGKTLRRSHDHSSGKSAIHMVSAWSNANGVVLGQEKTAEKSNEITAIPKLLEVLELKNCIVTIDAMGCQSEIAKAIVSKKADYVLALKGNQGHFAKDVKMFFESALENEFNNIPNDCYDEIDAGHGRIEHRQCWVIDPSQYKECFSDFGKWVGLKSIAMIKSRREIQGKVTEEFRFYISSCAPNSKTLMNAVRKHWGVENCLHWVLDVTFREDESRIRVGSAPENLAVIRHMAMNTIKKDTSLKASVKRKRARAALCDDYRTKIIQKAFLSEN